MCQKYSIESFHVQIKIKNKNIVENIRFFFDFEKKGKKREMSDVMKANSKCQWFVIIIYTHIL